MSLTANPILQNPRLRGMVRSGLKFPLAGAARLSRGLTPQRLRRFDKLHLGCGPRRLQGWANIDIDGLGALNWDLRKPLPINEPKVRFVYSEHFIEHIGRDDAVRLFSHARKVMLPGAVLRVSTPDLRKLAFDFLEGRLVHMEHGNWYPRTPCEMFNQGMRMWGHVYVYDEAELSDVLRECGFHDIRRVSWGESDHAELRGLESRPDFDDLILEARA